MSDDVKKPNLLDLAEFINDTDQWTLDHLDPETGEIIASPEDIKKYFGAPDEAEQKIIKFSDLKQQRLRCQAHIDREVKEIGEEMDALMEPFEARLKELGVIHDQHYNQIEHYKAYIKMFMEISGTQKFNYGVTKAHLRTNKSVHIPDDFDVSTLPERFRKTTIAPIKKELKAGIEAADESIPDAITIKESQSFIWS